MSCEDCRFGVKNVRVIDDENYIVSSFVNTDYVFCKLHDAFMHHTDSCTQQIMDY